MPESFNFHPEHFFKQRLENNEIVDEKITRSLSYDPEKLGLEKKEQRIDILEHTIPLEQNTAILRIAEYHPVSLDQFVDPNQPEITMIIIGGGASPGVGTNIKLAVEAEQELIKQAQAGRKIPRITRILIAPNPSGSAREKHHSDSDSLATSAKLVKQALKHLRVEPRPIQLSWDFQWEEGLQLN